MSAKKNSSLGWTDRVRVERRDERKHIRVPLPFHASIDGVRHQGIEISTGDFVVERAVAATAGRYSEVLLTFDLDGVWTSISFHAAVTRTDVRADRTELHIVEIGEREKRLLRNLVESYLGGTFVTVDELVALSDDAPDTLSGGSGPFAPGYDSRPGFLGRAARYGTLMSVTALLIVFAAIAAYDRFYVLEAPFAATTAPRFDVRAPGEGLYDDFGLVSGETIGRDDPIGVIADAALDSDLALAKATLSYQEEVQARLSEALKSEDTAALDALTASLGNSNGGGTADVALLLAAESRLEELGSLNDMERARVDALQQRVNANELFSPCDCVVHWARGGSDTWVQEGEKLYELIPQSSDETMVEAQIPMDFVPRLDHLQTAIVELPDGSTLAGRVIEINLEGENRPRAGFPEWVRHDMSKATVLIEITEKTETVPVGSPVKVSFSTATPDIEPVVSGIKEIARDGVAALVNVFSLGDTDRSAPPVQTSAIPDTGADDEQSE
jgi:alginate biosynthesis protein Alg44